MRITVLDPKSHNFKSKTFRRCTSCDLCKQDLQYQGSCCKVCKYSCHRHCVSKVIAACELLANNNTKNSNSKSSDKLGYSRSLERVPSFVMDITYVTERIIVILFPEIERDATYRSNLKSVTQMLQTKHANNYMVFNLSEKRNDLTKLNPHVLEFGWPQYLAPPLERLCSICKSMDTWMNSDPQHIVVLHSKGDRGRAGIIIAAYMHYSNICASADQALDRFAMKQFYDDKLALFMHPSQKRYVHYFAGLLSGAIRMNNNPLFLHHIVIYGVPDFDTKGGCRPFIKIYQGMQPVYTSGVYTVTERTKHIIITLKPSVPVRGDVLVKCYHKKQRPLCRPVIFRVQFHTCTIDTDHLEFLKEELDDALLDSRFPDNAKVEFRFSYCYNGIGGNDGSVTLDNSDDPLVKWDSYENFGVLPEDSGDDLEDLLELSAIQEGPVDGSLYASVMKKKYTDTSVQPHTNHDGFYDLDGPHSIDSGISSSSGTRGQSADGHYIKDDHAQLDDLVNGMLREIQSIPDAPSARYYTSSVVPVGSVPRTFSRVTKSSAHTDYTMPRSYNGITHPAGVISVNGTRQIVTTSGHRTKPTSVEFLLDDDEEDKPYHARKKCAPFSYGIEPSSPALQRRRILSEPQSSNDYGRDSSQSWLQRQQEKLKARKEGRGWEDRIYKEQQLLAELRTAQYRKATDSDDYGLDFSSSSRENSPAKNLSYTMPLHVNTYNGYYTTKPPIYKGTSAPSSPLLPSRSSSKDITRTRYQQQLISKPLVRQKSDTSFDRERPFVAAKRAHQLAKEQIVTNGTSPQHVISSSTVYGNIYPYGQQGTFKSGGDSDLLLTVGNKSGLSVSPEPASVSPGSSKLDELEQSLQALSGSSRSPTHSPQPSHSPISFVQSTPVKAGSTDGAPSWSPSVVNTSPPGSPSSRGDRPITPAFPVPPGTPYQNQESSTSALPPKSPLLARHVLTCKPVPEEINFGEHQSQRGSPGSSHTWSKDRSPSPATIQNMRQELPGSAKAHSANGQSSPTVYFGQSRPSSMLSLSESTEVIHHHPMFVKDTSKFWYKPDISREEAINMLKDKPPGTFVVRDSNSFPGAFGLALKVATPPPNVQNKSGDLSNELVRHFLIEPTSKGVRLKGCPNEPVFGSLSALVYQHSITPMALPYKLLLPETDPAEFPDSQINDDSAAALLAQGAACSVLYLGSLDTESLTGPQAIKKTLDEIFNFKPLPVATAVHFKVSGQGITLTDSNRKIFFRRHYPVKSISFCGLDPDERRWTQINEETGLPISSSRTFGFIARKPANKTDNQCHLFAELEPEQPATAIVNFVTKVMMVGSQQSKTNMV